MIAAEHQDLVGRAPGSLQATTPRRRARMFGPRKPRTQDERWMAKGASLSILHHSVLEKEFLDPRGAALLEVRGVGMARPDSRTEHHAIVDSTIIKHPIHTDLWPEAAARLTEPWAWLVTTAGTAYHLPSPLERWVESILADRATWLACHVRFSMDDDGRFFPPIELLLPSSPNWSLTWRER